MNNRNSIFWVVLTHLNLYTKTQCISSQPNEIFNLIKSNQQHLIGHSLKNPNENLEVNNKHNQFKMPPHPAQNRVLELSDKRFLSGLSFVDFDHGTTHHHLRMHQERRKLEISKNDDQNQIETTQHDSKTASKSSTLKDESMDKNDEATGKKKDDSGWWEQIGEIPDPTYSHLGVPSNRRSLSSTLYKSQVSKEESKLKQSKKLDAVEDTITNQNSSDFDDFKNLTEAYDLDNDIAKNVHNENNQSYYDELMDELPNFDNNAHQMNQKPKDEKEQFDEYDNPDEEPHPIEGKTKEWMIISGGFTDEDWNTFPVWAYDLSTSHETNSGMWIPLHVISSTNDHDEQHINPTNQANSNASSDITTDKKNETEGKLNEMIGDQNVTPGKKEPTGRVGHLTAVYDGYLYVFGGLTYNKRNFFVDDELMLWRAKIDHFLTPTTNDEGTNQNANDASSTPSNEALPQTENNRDPRLDWEIIIPNIKEGVSQSILKKLRRGEAQGAIHDRIEIGEDDQEYHKSRWIIHGGLHTRSPSSSPNRHSQPVISDIPLDDVWSYDFEKNEFELLDAGCYNDMECVPTPIARTAHAGTILGDTLVIYGGMTTVPIKEFGERNIVEKWKILDDVWSFDLNNLSWRPWNISPPLGRSYHSLVSWDAVVPKKKNSDDELSSKDDGLNEKSKQSNKQVKSKGGIIDLEREKDGRARGSIISYGGFTTYETLPGESIAFVFSDTILSHPPREVELYDSFPQKLPTSVWYKVQLPPGSPEAVSHRLEHTSIMDSSGTLFVWGGRFRNVDKISGMWSLNLFGQHSRVQLKVADPDGLDEYETQLETLHLLVLLLLFMSFFFTAMYGTMRRRAEEHGQMNDGPSFLGQRVRGATQEIIDAIPVKVFRTRNMESKDGNSQLHNTTDQTMSGESSECLERSSSSTLNEDGQNIEDHECCRICLVEYENGDQIRILPCNHEFHKDCIDSWLVKNSSCPACRHSLFDTKTACQRAETDENSNDFTDEQHLNSSSLSGGPGATNLIETSLSGYTNHFGLGRRRRLNASRRWFGAFRRQSSGHVIITDGSENNGEEGQHYISSLELT